MNVVALTGNLTKDPELDGEGESRVCRMRLAVDGMRETLFVEVAAFGAQAESCALYLRKGHAAAVTGRLRLREWETEHGAKRSAYSIAADRVDFLSGGGHREEAQPVPGS